MPFAKLLLKLRRGGFFRNVCCKHMTYINRMPLIIVYSTDIVQKQTCKKGALSQAEVDVSHCVCTCCTLILCAQMACESTS